MDSRLINFRYLDLVHHSDDIEKYTNAFKSSLRLNVQNNYVLYVN